MDCCRTDGDTASPGIAAISSVSPVTQPSVVTPVKWPRRIAAFIKWALPVTALTLIPKCPACVAGYVLLLSGIGLSLPVAAALRWTVIVLSIAVLAYLLLRTGRRALTLNDGPAQTPGLEQAD